MSLNSNIELRKQILHKEVGSQLNKLKVNIQQLRVVRQTVEVNIKSIY